jgi:hypothetical protein
MQRGDAMSREGFVGEGETLEERRSALRLQADSQFVEREEFLTLLTSRRQLVRANDSGAGVWGLFEPATGKRFLIEEEKFLAPETLGGATRWLTSKPNAPSKTPS